MDIERFEQLVALAVEALPEEFASQLDNVAVMVADRPSAHQLHNAMLGKGETLLGLYEGIPLTERNSGYSLVAPDRITLFRLAIISKTGSDDRIAEEIGHVLRHEIAHHFGISDERLDELEQD